jgi:hypothetical protein
MQLIERHIKALMLVSGALTVTMVYAAVAPAAALRSTFGESLQGPLAEVVVRNWGILIALMGGLLLHGAFNPQARRTALLTAGASKLAFIALVLASGTRFLGHGAGTAVAIDAVMVLLFAGYLLTAPAPRPHELADAATVGRG